MRLFSPCFGNIHPAEPPFNSFHVDEQIPNFSIRECGIATSGRTMINLGVH